MSKTLRPYQEDIVNRAIEAKGNILIQAPTGAGKTFIAENIISHHESEYLENIDFHFTDYRKEFFMEVLNSKHCDSTVLKSIVETKHDYAEEKLRKIYSKRNLRKDFKAMLAVVFEK